MFDSLHDLAGKGNLEGVQKFLRSSAAKINKTNRDGQTALHLAARGGHMEVCRELLASVASVDAEDGKHRTPLVVAVENNKFKVAKVLCEAGASTNAANPADGRQPLHVAACQGFVECAEILLQHGAPIDGNPDKWGHIPEENCTVSEIRALITMARQDRAAAKPTEGTPPYNPHAATAPLSTEDYRGEEGGNPGYRPSPEAPPSCHESSSPSHFSAKEENKGGSAGKPLSPLSQALKAAKLGGDCCAACNALERSRQLTPCHHVVCRGCARRARDEEEDGCPLCHSQVFDDNPVFM